MVAICTRPLVHSSQVHSLERLFTCFDGFENTKFPKCLEMKAFQNIYKCNIFEIFESENIQNIKKCEFEWKPESTGDEGATHSVSVKVSWVDQTLC